MAASKGRAIVGDGTRRERHVDDLYETPAECVDAILRVETMLQPIWEPAVGKGAIADRVVSSFPPHTAVEIYGTDIINHGWLDTKIWDFLSSFPPPIPWQDIKTIITNPPFKHWTAFMAQAVAFPNIEKVILFGKLVHLTGVERANIYRQRPPTRIWIFAARQSMWADGIVPSDNGGMIDFAWFVWDRHDPQEGAPRIGWLH